METKNIIPVFISVVLVISVFSTISVESFSEGKTDIVLVRTSDSNELAYIDDLGADILQTYDNFALVELDSAALRQLKNKGLDIEMMGHRTTLYVAGETFDFTKGEPEITDELCVDSYEPGEKGLYIVHMLGPIAQDWRPTMENIGVEILSYMHNYAYKVRMTPEQAEEVADLYFVDWVGIYHPEYKLQSGIDTGIVNIGLVPGASRDSLNIISGTRSIISSTRLGEGGYVLTALVETEEDLHELAKMNDVLYISERLEDELLGEMATQIIGGGLWFFDDDADPETAYREHGDYGSYMNQLGYTGDGVVIAVADTGLGGGTVDGQHEDFQDRVIGGYSFDDSGSWQDDHGHGTHVAGSIAGHTYGGTGEKAYNDYYAAQGSAPGAKLYSVRIFGGSGGSQWVGPDDHYDIVRVANENSDAYVHSNSWGTSTGDGAYEVRCSRYDAATRGENMVLLAAAGNSGSDDTTTIHPGGAKNLISVGATDTYNPDLSADNPEEVADFSSRGFTQDNRVKPDIVAPGKGIVSTGITSGYTDMSGTSMATPAVSGAAANVVQWYEDNHIEYERPSPAMVRAIIINTANPIDGNTRGPIPNQDEGWGMVDISKLARPVNDPIPFRFMDQEHIFTESGQIEEYFVESDRVGEPMKFTLTWTDKEAPPETESDPSLMNDLNIEIETPSGNVYRGNAFDYGWTQHSTDAMSVFDRSGDGWDDTNNVENVYIHPDDVEVGTYTVRIEARNIAEDGVGLGYNSQDFALAVHNANPMAPGQPPSATVISPNGGEVWDAKTEEEITWTTQEGDDPVDSISLAYSIDGGDNWEDIATGLEDTGSYTWTIPNVDSSECLVRVRALDTAGRWGDDLSDDVFTIVGIPPDPPENRYVEHISRWVEVLLDDDVESGDLGYTTEYSHAEASEWDIRQHGASSGANSWDFGDGEYNKTSEGMLSSFISPEITVPSNASEEYGVWFSFEHWRDFYKPSIKMYDGGNVKISTNGANGNFEIITPEEGYDGILDDSWDQPLGGEPGWGGTVDWATATFNLTDYIGETIHIRWDAGVNRLTSAGEGWRIDDIYIECEILDEEGDKDNRITWDASPDETIDEVSHYNIYRSDDPNGPWDGSTFVDTVEAVDQSSNYSYVDYEKGMTDGIFWWYVVRAVGTNGLEEQNTNAVQEPGGETSTFDISLTAGGDAGGWNFVSFNLVPLDSSLVIILEDQDYGISGNYDRVMYYDSGTDQWHSHVPGRAEHFNNLDKWDHIMGIWIRMTTSDTLTVEGAQPTSTDITLNPGWNMVGLPSETSGNHGLPGEVDVVGYFDSSQTYNLAYDYDPGAFAFEPGEGYWIHNPTDNTVTWTVDY